MALFSSQGSVGPALSRPSSERIHCKSWGRAWFPLSQWRRPTALFTPLPTARSGLWPPVPSRFRLWGLLDPGYCKGSYCPYPCQVSLRQPGVFPSAYEKCRRCVCQSKMKNKWWFRKRKFCDDAEWKQRFDCGGYLFPVRLWANECTIADLCPKSDICTLAMMIIQAAGPAGVKGLVFG